MKSNLRAIALPALAAAIAADMSPRLCFASNNQGTPTPNMVTVSTPDGGQALVPAAANCVKLCAPDAKMVLTNPGVYSVNDLNMMEAISQPLYDMLAYPAAGQLQFTFFQRTVGTGGTTKATTNMQGSGMLPSPQKFLISGFAVEFLSGLPPVAGPQADASTCNMNDYYSVMSNLAGVNGWFHLNIGDKGYFDLAPLTSLPPRSHVNGVLAAATNLTTGAATQTLATLGYSDGDVFKPVPLLLEANQNFAAQVNFPSLVALASTNTHSQLACYLYGTLYRAPQ